MNSILKETTLLDRLATYTGLGDADGHPIHNLHPYPAKYIPKLPREVISEHLNERHTLLDPFCGSGTSLVEGALARVRSIGIDSNPIACLISRAKTTPLSKAELNAAADFASKVSEVEVSRLPKKFWVPDVPRINHWFQRNVQRELSWIVMQIQLTESEHLKTFLLSVFSSIVTSVSNQDSETRYTAVDKGHLDGFVLGRFERKLSRSLEAASDWAEVCGRADRIPRVHNCSVERINERTIADDSVDLIVTSPPYPNSFDYYLYHKLRMIWLGHDVLATQSDEIGSRYEHSSRKAPIDTFISRMRPVMSQLARVLKPSKLAYFFVGDSVLDGKVVNMTEVYADLAESSGFRFLDERSYDLKLVSRSFKDTRTAAGHAQRHQKMQRVILLEGRSLHKRSATRAVATPVAQRLPTELTGVPQNGSTIAIRSDDADRHVHSIIPYPSKFIPEIPRWAINQYSQAGDTVLDPFSGSGTTAVEALIYGRNAISVDVSPWASLVARAKTTVCCPNELRHVADELLRVLAKPSSLPRAKHKRFELDEFWFNLDHLNEFARINRFIEQEVPRELSAFFRVALGSTVRSFSYQDPAQLKVKRDPRKIAAGTQSPATLLGRRLPGLVDRLCRFNELATNGATNTVASASIGHWINQQPDTAYIDLLVTSPPYINAMNYAMTSRYELLLLGLIVPDELNSHQQDYYGTERVYARDYRELHQFDATWSSARELNQILSRIYMEEPKRAFIVYDYFVRMREAFSKILPRMRGGGRIVVVTGTNTIRQVYVDTHRYLMESIQDLGATLECEFHYEIIKQRLKITRHDTASVIPHDGVAVLRWGE